MNKSNFKNLISLNYNISTRIIRDFRLFSDGFFILYTFKYDKQKKDFEENISVYNSFYKEINFNECIIDISEYYPKSKCFLGISGDNSGYDRMIFDNNGNFITDTQFFLFNKKIGIGVNDEKGLFLSFDENSKVYATGSEYSCNAILFDINKKTSKLIEYKDFKNTVNKNKIKLLDFGIDPSITRISKQENEIIKQIKKQVEPKKIDICNNCVGILYDQNFYHFNLDNLNFSSEIKLQRKTYLDNYIGFQNLLKTILIKLNQK